jgi:hypothetical protein
MIRENREKWKSGEHCVEQHHQAPSTGSDIGQLFKVLSIFCATLATVDARTLCGFHSHYCLIHMVEKGASSWEES